MLPTTLPLPCCLPTFTRQVLQGNLLLPKKEKSEAGTRRKEKNLQGWHRN